MSCLLAFASTHEALRAESLLKRERVAFSLDPAPKALTSFCELVIRVDESALDAALDVLERAGEGPKSVYRTEGERYVKM